MDATLVHNVILLHHVPAMLVCVCQRGMEGGRIGMEREGEGGWREREGGRMGMEREGEGGWREREGGRRGMERERGRD